MKKHVKIFLVSALIIALAGCSAVKNTEKNNDENEIKEPTEIITNSGDDENKISFKKIYGGEDGKFITNFAYELLEDENSEKTEWKAEEKTLAEENLLLNSKSTDVKVLLNKTIKIKDEAADTGEHIVGNFVLDIDGKTFDGDCIYLGTGSEGSQEKVDLYIIRGQDNIDYILVIIREPAFTVEGSVYAYIYNTSGTLLKKQLIDNAATTFAERVGEPLKFEILDTSITYHEQDWNNGTVNQYELSINNNEVNKKLLKSYNMRDVLNGGGAMT